MAGDLLRLLESLPPGPLYAVITVLAAVENIFPLVPADVAVALGAFLAGRGLMNPWVVFGLTWGANALSAVAVYGMARRYGTAVFAGRLGRRLLSQATLARIAQVYERHGTYGIYLSRLLPVWRAVVVPFAGLVGLTAPRALPPIVLASATYYGALTWGVYTIGGNLEDVLRLLGRVNTALAAAAAAVLVLGLVLWRRRRPT